MPPRDALPSWRVLAPLPRTKVASCYLALFRGLCGANHHQKFCGVFAVPFSPTLNLRAILRDGEPWFVAKDVCDALGIRSDSIRSILDADEIATIDPKTIGDGPGKARLIVNESGLYSLILRSRKPEAKRFKKWVTAEVLPAIRKTGGYSRKEPGPVEAPGRTAP